MPGGGGGGGAWGGAGGGREGLRGRFVFDPVSSLARPLQLSTSPVGLSLPLLGIWEIIKEKHGRCDYWFKMMITV